MKCLSDELMSMYLDNELPSDKRNEVKEHLEQCTACKKEYKAISKIEDIIINDSIETYYQESEAYNGCLSDDILYQYIDKKLPISVINQVEKHFDECDHCLIKYYYAMRMHNTEDDPVHEVPDYLQKQASQIMETTKNEKYFNALEFVITISKRGLQIAQEKIREKSLHFQLLPIEHEPLMALRGANQDEAAPGGLLVKKEYASHDITLTIHMYLKNNEHINLHIELSKNKKPYNQARVYLLKNDVVLFSKATANDGTTTLYDVSPGQYCLRIPKEDIEITFCINEDD